MAVYQNQTSLASEIKAKRKILREVYGGMMTLRDLMVELGYQCEKSASKAAKEMGLPATKVGKSKKYDTDVVARRLVELRGMC